MIKNIITAIFLFASLPLIGQIFELDYETMNKRGIAFIDEGTKRLITPNDSLQNSFFQEIAKASKEGFIQRFAKKEEYMSMQSDSVVYFSSSNPPFVRKI